MFDTPPTIGFDKKIKRELHRFKHKKSRTFDKTCRISPKIIIDPFELAHNSVSALGWKAMEEILPIILLSKSMFVTSACNTNQRREVFDSNHTLKHELFTNIATRTRIQQVLSNNGKSLLLKFYFYSRERTRNTWLLL